MSWDIFDTLILLTLRRSLQQICLLRYEIYLKLKDDGTQDNVDLLAEKLYQQRSNF